MRNGQGLTIAIAKGRILDGARQLFEDAGVDWAIAPDSRQLWAPPADRTPGLIIARAKDISTFVAQGIADLGIVGLDILREYPDPGILEVADLAFAQCRVVLAGRRHEWPDGPCRVATKYQHITRSFFQSRSHPIEIVAMSGSLELAPVVGLAPYIVDIVDTGGTLREHGLTEITTILSSSARLIANPSHWRTKPAVPEFKQRLVAAGRPSPPATPGTSPWT